MARVKICAAYGHPNDPQEIFCVGLLPNGEPCGVPIEHIEAQDEESVSDLSAAGAVVEEVGSPTSLRSAERNSEGSGERGERDPEIGVTFSGTSMPTMREPRRFKAELVFPWGSELVGTRLVIGRDEAFSPLAARIQEHPRVSGVHAELTFDGARLVVRHLGKTNPTRVNGRPLETGECVEVTDGEELGFSTDLIARVRIS